MKKVKDLKGAFYNPRIEMNKEELSSLKKALWEFGDLSGIVFNRRTGRLVSGHQRCKVIPKENEITITERYNPPTRTGTVAEGWLIIDGEKYSYREVDWPEDKEKAANLAANNQGSVNDPGLLSSLLKQLNELGTVDMGLLGFSTDELDDFLKEETKEEAQIKEWELDDLAMPFWAVIRCPIDKVDQVKSALSGLGEDVIIETSL